MDPVAHLTTEVEDAAAEMAGNGRRGLRLDRPPRADFGDYSTNAAMLLAPSLGEPPRAVAEKLGDRLGERLGETVERVEIAGPGFVNLFMADAWYLETLAALVEAGEDYGAGSGGEHVNLEFVSANPTGPITIASARHAAYGDSLARILERAGHRVEREYYVNDAGSQVQRFGESIRARARGEEPPDDGYRGEYVTELAERIPGAADAEPDELARQGIELMLEGVRATLAGFRVHMDEFFTERSLHASGEVEAAVDAAGGRVRARRRALAPHELPRRRQGPRPAALERRVDLLRLRHRLPRAQDRPRLRPRDRRLGPRPPRPHQADEDRVGGARRRSREVRDRDHAVRQPHGGAATA